MLARFFFTQVKYRAFGFDIDLTPYAYVCRFFHRN